MRADLTDITLVVDRSGSMSSIRDDAEGGVNTLVIEQAKEPGEALLTLVQFDTEYEFVHRGVPIGAVPKYSLVPRGSTALLDAIGRAIHETGERLARMNEADRPSLVLFVVTTDGQENASREFSRTRIREMIEHQQRVYDWKFTFMGANQDAFTEAGNLGMRADGVANYDPSKVAEAYRGLSSKMSRMRAQQAAEEVVDNEFTDQERKDMS